MQVVSSLANKELLLFKTDGTSSDILKIVYIHQVFSELNADVLSGAQDISISVRRDASCDESLSAFVKESPTIPLEAAMPHPLRESSSRLRYLDRQNPTG